jgi:hypothetical protein
MRERVSRLIGWAETLQVDALVVAGASCVLFGLSAWSKPATWIVAGLFLWATAWAAANRQ